MLLEAGSRRGEEASASRLASELWLLCVQLYLLPPPPTPNMGPGSSFSLLTAPCPPLQKDTRS